MLLREDKKFLAVAKSRGAAISRNDKSVQDVIEYLFKQGATPADIAESADAIRATMAEGMGLFKLTHKVKDLTPAHGKFSCAELNKDTKKAIEKQIADKKEAKKHSRDPAFKKKAAADIELLRLRLGAMEAVHAKLSYEPREWTSKLITLYKKDAKQKALTANKKKAGYTSKDAMEVADELGYNLRQEADKLGLKTKYTQGEKAFDPKEQEAKAKADAISTWRKRLADAKVALQKEEKDLPDNFKDLLVQIEKALA